MESYVKKYHIISFKKMAITFMWIWKINFFKN